LAAPAPTSVAANKAAAKIFFIFQFFPSLADQRLCDPRGRFDLKAARVLFVPRFRLADSLRDDPRVAWVNYTGFPDSPYHPLVQKYLDGRASSLFTFGIKGGMEAGKAFYDSLKLITRLVNIGDAKSLACHPASTTHRQMSAEQQRQAGVLPETIRLSIGIEHIADIIEDLDQALAQACGSQPRLAAE
jgi:O-acetylhomoserine (thiol)-lyase